MILVYVFHIFHQMILLILYCMILNSYFEHLEQNIWKYNDLYKKCVIGDFNAGTADRNIFIKLSSVFDKDVHTLVQNTEECSLLLNNRKIEDMICNASGFKLLDMS
jgi:hypothetical protein